MENFDTFMRCTVLDASQNFRGNVTPNLGTYIDNLVETLVINAKSPANKVSYNIFINLRICSSRTLPFMAHYGPSINIYRIIACEYRSNITCSKSN